MIAATLGVAALSSLYDAVRGPSPGAGFTPPEPVSLTKPQPPTDQSPIRQTADRLVRDLDALLLGVQAKRDGGTAGSPGLAAKAYARTAGTGTGG